MQNLNEIRTANWVLRLPADWSGTRDQQGGFHFESGDGNKALFIATHIVGPEQAGSLEQLAEWFAAAEMATLNQMAGYAWVDHGRSCESGQGVSVALFDSVAPAQQFRVVGKILARAGQVVRACFHDYQCRSHAASEAYFAPILATLELVELAAQSGVRLH